MKVQPWAAATAAFAAGSLAAVGIAQATSAPTKIPDSSTGVITACMVKKTGAVRFINAQAGKTCNSKEKKVTFNQKGPEGATGPAGAQGERGPSNAFVKNSTANVNIAELAIIGANTLVSLDLPAGKYVLNANTSGHASNATTKSISCEIFASAGTVTTTPSRLAYTAPLTEDADYAFAATATYSNDAAGTVRFECYPSDLIAGLSFTGAATMRGATLTATRVADLTVQ